MNEHVAEKLPLLLSGEASRADMLQVASHVRTCVDCKQELTSALAAHAALASGRRYAPHIVAARPDRTTGSAPPSPAS